MLTCVPLSTPLLRAVRVASELSADAVLAAIRQGHLLLASRWPYWPDYIASEASTPVSPSPLVTALVSIAVQTKTDIQKEALYALLTVLAQVVSKVKPSCAVYLLHRLAAQSPPNKLLVSVIELQPAGARRLFWKEAATTTWPALKDYSLTALTSTAPAETRCWMAYRPHSPCHLNAWLLARVSMLTLKSILIENHLPLKMTGVDMVETLTAATVSQLRVILPYILQTVLEDTLQYLSRPHWSLLMSQDKVTLYFSYLPPLLSNAKALDYVLRTSSWLEVLDYRFLTADLTDHNAHVERRRLGVVASLHVLTCLPSPLIELVVSYNHAAFQKFTVRPAADPSAMQDEAASL